jgi:hypothetical protein
MGILQTIDAKKGVGVCFLESFLPAGTSALLISVSHLRPEYWFVSLFALVPFLRRAVRVGLFESMALGALLATSYCFVTVGIAAWGTPSAFLLKLLSLNVFFALYGLLVNRISKHIGFNVIFIAVLWLPIEYALNHYAHMGSIFTLQEGRGSTVFLRISSLFGVLMLSFFVVLINSLILITTEHFLRALCSSATLPAEDKQGLCEIYREMAVKKSCDYFIDPRAPPLFLRFYI